MEQYEKNIIPQIESIYNSFTPLEKTIADFFINNSEKTDLSSKSGKRKRSLASGLLGNSL